jgi:hypothetical protein
MQPWVWLTVYVLGFGLLQVVLYRHFSQQTPSPETTEGRVTRTSGGRTAVSEAAETVTCPHCDTVNESHRMIRYCGSCAESLR